MRPWNHADTQSTLPGGSLRALGVLALIAAVAGISCTKDSSPTKYSGLGFEFSYPASWRLATEIEHFDPDHFVLVESPDGARLQVEIAHEYDPAEVFASFSEKVMDDIGLSAPVQTGFATWAGFEGFGRVFEGFLDGPDSGYRIRVFVSTPGDDGFMIVETWPGKGDQATADALELIEETFRFEPGTHAPRKSDGGEKSSP